VGIIERVRKDAAAVFAVRLELQRAIIGPFLSTAGHGCSLCAEERRNGARRHADAHQMLWSRYGDDIAKLHPTSLTAASADLVVCVICAEIEALARRHDPSDLQTFGAFLAIDLLRFDVRRHTFLPNPMCRLCAQLPNDNPDAAAITLQPRLKIASSRARTAAIDHMTLRKIYSDSESGVIGSVQRYRSAIVAGVVASAGRGPGQTPATGWGRSLDYATSEATAIAEALERLGGLAPRGVTTVVRAPYRELVGQALNPQLLGLYPEDRYVHESLPYRRFDEDLVLPWVYGYSFAHQAPILVPESYAYYGHHHNSTHSQRPFVYEISNGCALGNCLEEAVLHGLLEVAERDAFLLTWYARLSIPRVDPETIDDPTARLLISRIATTTGLSVALFVSTMEQGIPCWWVMGIDERQRSAFPKAVCAAGSGLDASSALLNALSELAGVAESARRPLDAATVTRALEMVEDPALVREMSDHSLLYYHPQAFNRFDFLLDSKAMISFSEVKRRWPWPHHLDLSDDLREAVARYLRCGLDVIVVQQTTDEHRAGGFDCVKVVVPGTLPMTFGHSLRRTDGIPRILDVPVTLGYRDRPLQPFEINRYPHPFP